MKVENERFGLAERRIYGLDILRSVAILSVIYDHGYHIVSSRVSQESYWRFFYLDGVTLFFVLSGFLIGGIFIKKVTQPGYDTKQLFNFWIRRWFRTLPNYYLVLVVLITLHFFL